ncbi:MAG: MBL fold metallo-hydrolase [Bacteroidales bacterium]|nr:MBL fold metallo-hydrolase [Bacteroidales bacterium]
MKNKSISIVKQIIVGELETNCYLFISGNELAIIDPGDEAEKILKEIKKTKAKLKYIINTHYHFDHILANEKIKKETGAQILIHEDEKAFIDFDIDKFLKEGSKINIGKSVLKVIHTPGHTKGGICLLGEDFVFTGDTLFKGAYGRTDLAGGSQKDLMESLERLSKLLKPEMMVYPGHGEIFKI